VRLLRFQSSTGPRDGVVADGTAYEAQTVDGAVRPGRELGDPADLELLAPVSPATIVCVGRNQLN